LYPPESSKPDQDKNDVEENEDVEDMEAAMAKEIAELNKPRQEHRFGWLFLSRFTLPCGHVNRFFKFLPTLFT
jgi:hypothetical protein